MKVESFAPVASKRTAVIPVSVGHACDPAMMTRAVDGHASRLESGRDVELLGIRPKLSTQEEEAPSPASPAAPSGKQ